jgi:hypothetical protein
MSNILASKVVFVSCWDAIEILIEIVDAFLQQELKTITTGLRPGKPLPLFSSAGNHL